jgi:hypothetical protein
MKLFTATFFTASLISLHALVAQDAATVPVPDTAPPAPPVQLAPEATPAPATLFPNETPPPIVDKPAHNNGGDSDRGTAQNPPAKRNTTEENKENVSNNIAYRKAKTKALRDEKVQQALADVAAAKTDQDKRAALKRYYTLLADRILKIDGSIKKLVASRLKDSLKELDQSKVRPEEYQQQASAEH